MAGLRGSLKEAVRKLAFNTSVDQLRKSGIKKVNVLGIDRIVSLIDEAVSRSLRHRLLASERAEVVDATKEEFLKLLKSNQDLQRSHEELARGKEQAESNAEELRRELDGLGHQLREQMGAAELREQARYDAEDSEIDSDVAMLFDEIGRAGGDPSTPEAQARVRELIGALVGRERDHARRSVEAARNSEVENLQRRISKLQRSLDVTEKRLVEVSQSKNVDDGVASIYREVQGLTAGSGSFEKKKGLMEDIFKANMALQRSQVVH